MLTHTEYISVKITRHGGFYLYLGVVGQEGGPIAGSQSGLQSESKVSLGYETLSQIKKSQNKQNGVIGVQFNSQQRFASIF